MLTQENKYAKRNGLEKRDAFLRDAGAAVPEMRQVARPVSAEELATLLTHGTPAEERAYRASGTVTLREKNINLQGLCLYTSLLLEGADNLTMTDCIMEGDVTIRANGALLKNCRIGGTLTVVGEQNTLRHINAETIMAQGVNLLVAQSDARAITVTEANNAVCLLNRAAAITTKNCRNLYVCENQADAITLTDCAYVVANGNRMPDAGAVTHAGLSHFVGSDVTDIRARVACGVNRDLLPQGDKNAFTYLPRRNTVREETGARDAARYIMEEAKGNPLVILAPGVYRTKDTIKLEDIPDGCVIYAYGVLFEKDGYLSHQMLIRHATGVVVKGLQLDHTVNTNGQGVVIAKEEGNRIRMIPGAGMYPDWSDRRYYEREDFYGYHAGHPEPYADLGTQSGFHYDAANAEIIFYVSDDVFARMAVGDTVVCRGICCTAIQITESADTYFEDVVLYGSSGFAFNESSCYTATILHRVWDTTGPAAVINEGAYERYRAYERIYGVSFGVREDTAPDGRKTYRGTPPICSSVDATHTNRSVEGTVCISCTFESMCDDGTNQNASHARLAGYRDNGDGTLTVLYKSNISVFAFQWAGCHGGTCAAFQKGDRVYIYTSAGRLICDTHALSDGRATGSYQNDYGTETTTYEVDVAREAFNTHAADAYDMESDVPSAAKILIDNMTRASNGFVFDNVLVQNIRSRGLLIKASDGKIVNCSFYNCGMSCIAILYEIYWGESGVSEFLEVKNNYFENTGYYRNIPRYAPIAVEGLGTQAADSYLLYNHIVFEGNVMRRRGSRYAVFLNSAKQVLLKNNDFGTQKGESAENPQPSVYIHCVKDVELSGNTYSPYLSDIRDEVIISGNRHTFGSDVGDALPDRASETLESDYMTSMELRPPRIQKDGKVLFDKTPWQCGSMPVEAMTFSPYRVLNRYGWLADGDDTIWGGTGGIWAQNAPSYAAQDGYNVAIRYTAERDGKIRMTYTDVHADEKNDGFLAIFHNGQMVFPVAGGSYTDARDWQRIGKGTDIGAMLSALMALTVSVKKGDTLLFTVKRDRAWANFSAVPLVAYQ